MQILLSYFLILIFTTVLGRLSVHIGLPAVVGQLLAGLLLGPALLNWVALDHLTSSLSELGVVLLMFLAGLNSDLTLLKKYLKPSLMVAVLGMIIPMGTFYLIGRSFNWPLQDALFLGVIFAATSVSITVEVLREINQLNSRQGVTILGAAVADDILTVILLSVVVTLSGAELKGQMTNQLNLGTILLLQVDFLVMLIIVAKWILKRLIDLVDKLSIPYQETILGLVLALLASIGAELVGLSSITGAFLAGLALSRFKISAKIDQEVSAIGYLFVIPFFFVSVGLEIKPIGIIDQLGLFLVLVIAAVLTKWMGAGIGAALCRFDLRSATTVGAGMISRGEVALIIAQLVFTNHLLSSDQYSAIISAVVVATILSPLLLRWSIRDKN